MGHNREMDWGLWHGDEFENIGSVWDLSALLKRVLWM